MILTIVGILVFIVVLTILVLIHELGHYLTAKKFGIKVEEFGFGFPPRAFGIKRGETIYSINWLPIGGFVKLYGEDDAGGGSVKRKEHSEDHDLKRAFFARPAWQRAVVILAGVFMNFVLALVIITFLFSGPGIAVPKGYTEVVKAAPNTPASQIHLQKGDIIVSFDSKPIRTTGELRQILAENKGKEGALVVKRNGQEQSYEVSPAKLKDKETGESYYAIGVTLNDTDIKKYPWYTAPFYGTIEMGKFSWLILTGLGGVVGNLATKGQVPTDAAGPVGIAQIVIDALKYGIIPLLWISAVLSLNLAVINVLPIPALDGGRLFFILIELVTGKKVPQKYESLAHAIGLAVLLTLIVVITFFDITRLISGKSLVPQM